MSEGGQSSEGAQENTAQQGGTSEQQQQGKTAPRIPHADFYHEDPTGKEYVAQTQKESHALPVPEGEELDRLLEEERRLHPGQSEADLLTRVTDRIYNAEAIRLGEEQFRQKHGMTVAESLAARAKDKPEEPQAKSSQEPTPEDALRMLGHQPDDTEEE